MKRLLLASALLAVCLLVWPEAATAQDCAGGCNTLLWPAENPVWEFCWIPPRASSGTNGSGIEIRDVKYKGRSVLKRGHAPILNVEYDPGGCGCFRDWLDQEVRFQADGVVNECFAQSTPDEVQTVCDVGGDGGDIGSFSGVATEEYPDRLVLTSQNAAGWYRYTMQWIFYLDGRIQPQFGYSSVPDPCVQNTHNHHTYWRLDFDIEDSAHDYIVESSNLAEDLVLDTETARTWGDPTDNVAWTVLDTQTGRGYQLTPGASDYGMPVDDFSQTDAFFTAFKPLELDDQTFQCAIRLNGLVNGEAINDTDVVMWYRGGSRHIGGELDECEIVGPTLTPVGDWDQEPTTFAITVTPQNPPVVIPPEGGTFTFTVNVTNNTSAAQTTSLWFSTDNEATGTRVTKGPFTLSLDPNATFQRTLTQRIPGGLPSGTYTYTGAVGTFPTATASSSFAFEKQATAARPARAVEDGNLVDARTGQPLKSDEIWASAPRAEGDRPTIVPSRFALEQNYPNPFTSETTIRYAVREAARVTLTVYNALGQPVRTLVDEDLQPGFRSVTWNSRDDTGTDLPSGTYFYKLTIGAFEQTRMMILLR